MNSIDPIRIREELVKDVHTNIGFAMFISRWRQWHFEFWRGVRRGENA
jgi:hypothetical protein